MEPDKKDATLLVLNLVEALDGVLTQEAYERAVHEALHAWIALASATGTLRAEQEYADAATSLLGASVTLLLGVLREVAAVQGVALHDLTAEVRRQALEQR